MPQDITAQTRVPQDVTVQTSMPQDITAHSRVPQDVTVQTSMPQDLTVQTRVPQDITAQTRVTQDITVQTNQVWVICWLESAGHWLDPFKWSQCWEVVSLDIEPSSITELDLRLMPVHYWSWFKCLISSYQFGWHLSSTNQIWCVSIPLVVRLPQTWPVQVETGVAARCEPLSRGVRRKLIEMQSRCVNDDARLPPATTWSLLSLCKGPSLLKPMTWS